MAACWLLPAVALALGLASLAGAQPRNIGPYGLISALPPAYYAALALLAAGFLVAWLGRAPRRAAIAAGVIVLVILLDGAPAIIENEPRFPQAWLHAGFTDFVAHTGRILPLVDARFSWPSFFTGTALLARAGGLPSAILLIRWWPVLINLAYLPPMFLIAQQVLRDTRKAMLATWLFPLTNWVGQDYYSPQSVAYFLYLVLICVILRRFGLDRPNFLPWLRSPARFRRRREGQPAAAAPGRAAAAPTGRPEVVTLFAVMLVICAAMFTGHQLTPFFAVATVAALALVGRTRLAIWPAVMFLLAIGWVCYGAIAYWSGHFTAVFGGVGNVSGNFATDLRLRGSPVHYRIDDIRLLMFGGLWLLAFIGLIAGRKAVADRRAAIVMMLSPVVVISGQAYGGEAGLRAFMFSLPGALCLATLTMTALPRAARRALTGLLIAGLVPGFLIARWGNELSEQILPAEITGMQALYATAPAGSTLMAITPQVTWQFADIGKYQYAPNNLDEFAFGNLGGIIARLKNPRGGYVVITRSQLIYAEQAYGLPPDWGVTVERRLIASRLFRKVYQNIDTRIYKYVGRA